MERPNAWKTYHEADLEAVHAIGEDYKSMLSACKTEREWTKALIQRLEKKGYCSLDQVIAEKGVLHPGDRVYVNQMGKAVLSFHLGSRPLEMGLNIVGAHIDSPRLDLKQNRLYEDSDLAYGDTHYYGGIKKYQWVARELALHGVVIRKDGGVLELVIGEKDEDPVIGISDLLIHLAKDQMDKRLADGVSGEDLDLILAGRPLQDTEKEAVKEMLLKILKDDYGMEEEDFLSAEIEVVPAGKARDFGLDRSMILGYGHDDRVCAFAELRAIENLEGIPAATCCGMFVDKEEIGSVGATGMQAKYLENAVAELLDRMGVYSELGVRRALRNSRMLSCDVSAGYDPLYASAFEKKNAAYLGRGVCFNKFTGRGGKSGSNDANAEFLGRLRAIMDQHDVQWQTAELGKVDVGGGGTIAYICALYGMEVIDSGVAVLSMHAPMEIINKADLYEAVKAYTAFMQNA